MIGRQIILRKIITENKNQARTWMEVCRQFLIGPVHYSFGGVHSVSVQNPVIRNGAQNAEVMPAEIGQVLINKFDLVEREWEPSVGSVEEAISVYDDYEQARKALWNLKSAVEARNPDNIEEYRDEAAKIIDHEINKHQNLVRTVKMLAATGASGIGLINPVIGLLTALGYSIADHSLDDGVSETIASGVEQRVMSPQLTSIVGLWKNTN